MFIWERGCYNQKWPYLSKIDIRSTNVGRSSCFSDKKFIVWELKKIHTKKERTSLEIMFYSDDVKYRYLNTISYSFKRMANCVFDERYVKQSFKCIFLLQRIWHVSLLTLMSVCFICCQIECFFMKCASTESGQEVSFFAAIFCLFNLNHYFLMQIYSKMSLWILFAFHFIGISIQLRFYVN